MIYCGIDIGKKGAYSVMIDNDIMESKPYSFISLYDTYKFFSEIFDRWKPDILLTGKPNRMYNIILNHSQFIGILGLLAEKRNIPLMIVNDCTMRATVLGKGNGMKKDLVHETFKGETPDVSDSILFCKYLYLTQQ